jgi:hypothetical protein
LQYGGVDLRCVCWAWAGGNQGSQNPTSTLDPCNNATQQSQLSAAAAFKRSSRWSLTLANPRLSRRMSRPRNKLAIVLIATIKPRRGDTLFSDANTGVENFASCVFGGFSMLSVTEIWFSVANSSCTFD